MDEDNDKSSDFYLNQITELIELKKKENRVLKSMAEILIKNSDTKHIVSSKLAKDNNKE